MEKNIYYKLLNSRIFRNPAIRVIVSRIIDNCNILKALFGNNPSFVGLMRVAYRISYFLTNGAEKVRLTPSGIYANGKLVDKSKYQLMDFISREGIEFADNDVSSIQNKIRHTIFQKEKNIGRKYYRLRGQLKLVSYGFIFSIIYITIKVFSKNVGLTTSGKILEGMWILPNIFFFFQTILFYYSWLKYSSLKISFKEANAEEEHSMKLSQNQPYVVSVVPSHMEEPELLERVLYSICLQNYGNMQAMLLLGNDVYSKDPKILDNTRQIRKMVSKVKLDLRGQNNKIRKRYKAFNQNANIDSQKLSKEFQILSRLYNDTAEWFISKAKIYKTADKKYPTDSFLIKNTFVSQYSYYKRQANKCYGLSKTILLCSNYDRDTAISWKGIANEFYIELSRVFNTSLGIFMRTKYENVEHEKTKAGNLTAYSSLIGGRWSTVKNEDGKLLLVPSENGKYIKEPKYFSSFDSDTIIKPDYILRKITYLEKEENSKVGLVQSPYVVPSPENTIVASATGIQSYWFLPISVGLSAFNSAFWLGFNGVLRFEAVKNIKSFLTETIIEDTQNSLKLKSAGYEIVTSIEEQCTTFSPLDLKALKIQRIRWASGCFKITGDLIKSIRKGTSGLDTFRDKVLGLNYVSSLNILPLVTTALYFLESPLHYQFFLVEVIPFFLYILSYLSLLKTIANYSNRQILDGLALSPFLNLYHLVGTFYSIRMLFVPEKSRVFVSTPRNGKSETQGLGNLEFYGIMFIFFWLLFRMVNQIYVGAYYDFFPFFQLFLTIYGIKRFARMSKIKNRVIQNNDKGRSYKNLLKPLKKEFTWLPRIAYLSVGILFLSSFSVYKIYQKNLYSANSDKVFYTNLNYLQYKGKSAEMLKELTAKGERQELNAFQQRKRLGKGINFGSALEAPVEGEWGVYLQEEYFKIVKDAGFDTVRIPINWSAYTQTKKPYNIDDTFLSRIDWVLVNAKKYNLNAVLEIHNYDEINFDINKNSDRFISMWGQISKRYKDCDESLYLELLNEPHANLTPQKWNKLLEDTVKEIRKNDPYHTLIISGAQWGNAYGLQDLKIPQGEKNIICTFHTYTPMAFTHQGVNYAEKEYALLQDNIEWPGPPIKKYTITKNMKEVKWLEKWLKDYNTLPYEANPAGPKPILEELNLAYNWEKANSIPVWLGEFGVTKNADTASRINYAKFVAEEAEKMGITWAYWDFGANCGLYDLDKKEWEKGLLNALIH